MPECLVAIPHYADPAFSPHVRRQTLTLKKHGVKVWALGVRNPDQRRHGDVPYTRTDTYGNIPFLTRGPLAFLYFFLRVFVSLWKQRPDILQPIDAPALVPCWVHSVIRGIPLYYVSLEDLPHLTALNNKPVKRAIWTTLENVCIKRAKRVVVVAEIDAKSLEKRCKIQKPLVIRNVPDLQHLRDSKDLLLRRKFGWTEKNKVLMYHGVIEEGRGVELVFPYLKANDDVRLAVAGFGAWTDVLKARAEAEGIADRIGWVGPFVHADLPLWAQDADLGIVLIENISRAFFQVLPCKLFEYVHSVVPVVTSNFPEMQVYVGATGVGVTVDPADAKGVISAIDSLLRNPENYQRAKAACKKERERTNWQTESRVYLEFLGLGGDHA